MFGATLRAIAAVALAAGALAAVFTSAAGPPEAAVENASVSIQDFAFSPSSITVNPGDTVTWTNHDQTPHTVHANNGRFDSPELNTNASFSFTFEASDAGTITYFCTIHPSMTGSITVSGSTATVTPGATDTPLPTNTPAASATPSGTSPTVPPLPTSTTGPTNTPGISNTPVPTSTPVATQAPTASASPTPVPSTPTATGTVVEVTPLPSPAQEAPPSVADVPPVETNPAAVLLPTSADVAPGLVAQSDVDWQFGGDGFTGVVRTYARSDVDPDTASETSVEVSVAVADSPERAVELFQSTLRAFSALGYQVDTFPTPYGEETVGGFRDAGSDLPEFIYFRSGAATAMIRWNQSAEPTGFDYAIQLAESVAAHLAG